jgi:hypothetical protein
VHANCSYRVVEVASAAETSCETCHSILSDDLNTSHATQQIVSHFLMQQKCENHMNICDDLICSADKGGTFLNWIITGNKTCFLYDLRLKQQTFTWKSLSSPRRRIRDRTEEGKAVLELFFDSSGIVHMEFIPKGATVNKH